MVFIKIRSPKKSANRILVDVICPAVIVDAVTTHYSNSYKSKRSRAKRLPARQKNENFARLPGVRGSRTRVAARGVARKHGLSTKNGATQVKLWDARIRGCVASRSNRRSSERPKGFTLDVKKKISDFSDEDVT